MDIRYYLIAVLAFLSVTGMIEGLFALWRSRHGPVARKIARRLHLAGESGPGPGGPLLKQQRMSRIPAFERALQAMPLASGLDRLLRQSASRLNVLQLLGLTAAAAAAGAGLGWSLRFPTTLVLVAGLLGAAAPSLWFVHLRSQRLVRIDQQLPAVMDLMARALRAGHSFSSALQMAATEGPDPTAHEFHLAFDEISFGITAQDALTHLAERVPSNDLRYLVVAVLTQHETGGNLAELLGNTAELIRARHKLMGAVRVLATEGKFSAWILVILPFGLAAGLYAVNHEFLKTLWTDPAGLNVLVCAAVAMVIGIFWMWRAVKIHI